jgi:16S rRNA (guanine(966)-N(2))-methyltransferase RsmD
MKGRRFNPPKNLPIRPTTDFAKEGLFNLLRNQFELEGKSVLDLFAGSGAISLEMLSRGAMQVEAVELHSGCVSYLHKLKKELQLENLKINRADVFKYLKKSTQRYDLIFADPPYALPELAVLPDRIFEQQLLQSGGLLVIEHGKDQDFTPHPAFQSSRKYGNVNFTFFQLD